MKKQILCTLGPASMNDKVISRLEEMGVSLFRINLSHVEVEDVRKTIEFIQSRTSVPVCLDTEGAQIRTAKFTSGSIEVRQNDLINVCREKVSGDESKFNLYPDTALDALVEGDLISIDFNSVLVQVIEKKSDTALLRVLNGGKIGSNKAVTVQREIMLPVLTGKDHEAIRIGMEMGIENVALSFANRGSDVDYIRSLFDRDVFLISKIECRNALLNLKDICSKSDALLVDRGDLSREEAIERIPRLQKMIINEAGKQGRKSYVATNLLESMITSQHPTRAEVNDVINTLSDGVDGLVLAAETAIGIDPIGCVSMILKLMAEFEEGVEPDSPYYPRDVESLLPDPYLGKLFHSEGASETGSGILKLRVDNDVLLDAEQIAFGAYSPLQGFMSETELDSCLKNGRLKDGTKWTMPVVLRIQRQQVQQLSAGKELILTDDENKPVVQVQVTEVYEHDYGSREGSVCVAGSVRLIQRTRTGYRKYQLLPKQSRYLFTHKSWSRVVGVYVPDKGSVSPEIHKAALKATHADGIFAAIQPADDVCVSFSENAVLNRFQRCIEDSDYPDGGLILGAQPIRRSGDAVKDAIHQAIVMQNLGCSYMIADGLSDEEFRRADSEIESDRNFAIRILSADLLMNRKREKEHTDAV